LTRSLYVYTPDASIESIHIYSYYTIEYVRPETCILCWIHTWWWFILDESSEVFKLIKEINIVTITVENI